MEVQGQKIMSDVADCVVRWPITKFSSSTLGWRPKHAGGAGRLPSRAAARAAPANICNNESFHLGRQYPAKMVKISISFEWCAL